MITIDTDINTTPFDTIRSTDWRAHNFSLIWLDDSTNQFTEGCQNTLAQLRNIVNNVSIFSQRDECVDFLTDIGDIKVFLIIEDTLASQILPLIHDIPQLGDIYISRNKCHHEQCTKEWTKIKGVYTEIKYRQVVAA